MKSDAVYAAPNGVFSWGRCSGEEALRVLWAVKKLNPDKSEDISIEQETKGFHMQFHGYSLTDGDA